MKVITEADNHGTGGISDMPRSGKYFLVNQSNEKEIVFDFEAPKIKEVREQKGAKGIMYMLVAAIFFTLMAFLLKLLYIKSEISTYEVTYIQAIIMAVMNFGLFKAAGKDHLLVRDDMRATLILRSVCGFLGLSGFYLALQYTDLSKATALYWTNPMMTAVIAYFVINESLNFVDWLAIFVSFFGILIIESPWSREVQSNRTETDTMGSVAALLGAGFFAIAQM
jgi:drug/metabolite transporter (DMT)-like permease